jgi:hypothetical protein
MKLPEERSETKTTEFYFQQFKRLVDTGINIHLFLQSSMIPLYKETIGERENVFIEIQEFEDLEIPESISADISEPISGKMSLSDPVKASSTIPPRVMEIDDYSFLKGYIF